MIVIVDDSKDKKARSCCCRWVIVHVARNPMLTILLRTRGNLFSSWKGKREGGRRFTNDKRDLANDTIIGDIL